jgi:small subunit ribosomal protein S16
LALPNQIKMSVKIRLALTGKKHQISYRLVAQDIRSKRDGKFLEILGYFNPSEKDKNRTFVDKEKIKFWLAKGATFSQSAKYLVTKGELPPKPKRKVEPKKEPAPKQEGAPETNDQPIAAATQEVAVSNDAKIEKSAEEVSTSADSVIPEETAAAKNVTPAVSEEIKQEEAKTEEK